MLTTLQTLCCLFCALLSFQSYALTPTNYVFSETRLYPLSTKYHILPQYPKNPTPAAEKLSLQKWHFEVHVDKLGT